MTGDLGAAAAPNVPGTAGRLGATGAPETAGGRHPTGTPDQIGTPDQTGAPGRAGWGRAGGTAGSTGMPAPIGGPAPGTPAAFEGPDADPPVVAFGDVEPQPRGRSLADAIAGIRRDRRLVPTITGVGLVALFASLVSEWQVTTVDAELFGPAEQNSPDRRILSTVGDLDTWGTGYLLGLFLLVAMSALLLHGPRSLAGTVRVLALSTSGVLLALLAAIAIELDGRSVLFSDARFLSPESLRQPVEFGRGLTCAVIGVAALAAAAYLSGRLPAAHPDAAPTPAADGAGPPAAPPAGPDDEELEPAGWSWRRPPADPAAAPLDLTVQATTPFTVQPGNRDQER